MLKTALRSRCHYYYPHFTNSMRLREFKWLDQCNLGSGCGREWRQVCLTLRLACYSGATGNVSPLTFRAGLEIICKKNKGQNRWSWYLISSAFTAPLCLEIERFTPGPHSTSRVGSDCRHAHKHSKRERSQGRMLAHARAGISKHGTSQCLRQASLCICFSRCPGFLGHIELLCLEIPRNCGNSSFVNNNNKSLGFLRKYYVPVIMLSFDHSIDHS